VGRIFAHMYKARAQLTTERVAIPVSAVAQTLDVSERHVWALNSSGRLPRPIRLGRAVRWDRRELEQWIAAGAPTREAWERRTAG
jgi:predicted DNA-binding transcriptional regulator AlpA